MSNVAATQINLISRILQKNYEQAVEDLSMLTESISFFNETLNLYFIVQANELSSILNKALTLPQVAAWPYATQPVGLLTARLFDSASKSSIELLFEFIEQDQEYFEQQLQKLLFTSKQIRRADISDEQLEFLLPFVVEGSDLETAITAELNCSPERSESNLRDCVYNLDGVSFFSNDTYNDLDDVVECLNHVRVELLSHDTKILFLNTFFNADHATEWSVDGHSRQEAIKQLMRVYEHPMAVAIYKDRRDANMYNTLKVTGLVTEVVNLITQYTANCEKIITTAQQKWMLKQISTICQNYGIPVNLADVSWALEFKNSDEETAQSFGIAPASSALFEKTQKNLEEFINTLKQQKLTIRTKSEGLGANWKPGWPFPVGNSPR